MRAAVLVLLVACKSSGDGDAPVLDRRTTATWNAKVTAVEGRNLKLGDPCTVTANNRSDGDTTVATTVQILCGSTVVYAGPRFGTNMPGRICSVYEEPGDDPATFRYVLDCTDATQPRLKLDTRHGIAVIDGTGSAAFHVALEVDTKSSAWRGESLYPGNAPRDPGFDSKVELPGKLVEVIGLGADMKDAACTLRITPRTGRYNCHIFVACNGKTLYGGEGSGFTDCAIEHRKPMRAHDAKGIAEEGDPKLEMDLAKGEVIVSNDDPGATYRARIVVEKTAEQP